MSEAGMTIEARKAITAEKLQSQFKQNTGRALCDSGGDPKYDEKGNYIGSKEGYGRGYERLSNVNMDDLKPAVLRITKHGIEYTRSTYHFLLDRVNYSRPVDELWILFLKILDTERKEDRIALIRCFMQFEGLYLKSNITPAMVEEYLSSKCEADMHYLACMLAFGDCLKYMADDIGFGPYSESSDPDDAVQNTYNMECNLDTTLQFLHFSIEDSEYILLQTHNGADVRGGYSKPIAYAVDTDNLYDFTSGRIRCTGAPAHIWFTDDGYNWSEMNDGRARPKLLNNMQFVDYDDVVGEIPKAVELRDVITTGERQLVELCNLRPENKDKYTEQHMQSVAQIEKEIAKLIKTKLKGSDYILVHGDVAYCPKCGSKLVAD